MAFVFLSSMATFLLKRITWSDAIETIWITKLKTFTFRLYNRKKLDTPVLFNIYDHFFSSEKDGRETDVLFLHSRLDSCYK